MSYSSWDLWVSGLLLDCMYTDTHLLANLFIGCFPLLCLKHLKRKSVANVA